MKIARISSRIRGTRPATPIASFAGLCLLLSIPSLACAQSSTTGNSSSSTQSHSPAVGTNKIVVPQVPGAQLTTDRSAYTLGQPILLTLKITNTTKKTIRYDFFSDQQATFTVSDSKGNSIWTSTGPRLSSQGITHLSLDPGKSQSYQASWDERDTNKHPVPAGVYTATAKLAPMPRVVVTGGVIVNTDPDPDNTGMPTKGKAESGATLQQDLTPPVASSIQITIQAAAPQPASHPTAAH